jgi:hypothetical protein
MNNLTHTRILSALVLGLLLGLTAAANARAEAPLPVVASFSILGDLVTQVGGEPGYRGRMPPPTWRPSRPWTGTSAPPRRQFRPSGARWSAPTTPSATSPTPTA